jgi:carbonic anhydrase
MDRLIDGYRRFRQDVWPRERERFERLAEGQRPETLVVACSDSRVDPAMVFDAAPGELFVVRNVAGLVPPYNPDGGWHGVSAALEFGVRVLGVRQVVVLGHARCGGVQALVEGAPEAARDFVAPWVTIAEAALRRVQARDAGGDPGLDAYEREVVRLSLANLMTFPWIAGRVADGSLSLQGALFDVHTGVLSRLDVDGGFTPVEAQ